MMVNVLDERSGKVSFDAHKYTGWVDSIRKLNSLIPDGVLVGGAALVLQLAARKPELASQLIEGGDGPHDLDIVCPSESFSHLPGRVDAEGYTPLPSPPNMGATWFLPLSDRTSIPGRDLKVDVVREGRGPPIARSPVEFNGMLVYTSTPEELFLQRMFQLLGYERRGLGDLHPPNDRHFRYFKLNLEIVDDASLDGVFPLFKERMKVQRGIEIEEGSWGEMAAKVQKKMNAKGI